MFALLRRSVRLAESVDTNNFTCIPTELSFAGLHRLIDRHQMGDPLFTNASTLTGVRRQFGINFTQTPQLLPFNAALPTDFKPAQPTDECHVTSYDVHRSIYDTRADVRCIVHSYSDSIVLASTYPTRLASNRTRFSPNVALAHSENVTFRSPMEVDSDSSTKEYRTEISKALCKRIDTCAGELLPSAVLIPHNGAIVVGRSIQVCFLNLLLLDRYCRTATRLAGAVDDAENHAQVESAIEEFEEDQWMVAQIIDMWPRWLASVGLDPSWRKGEKPSHAVSAPYTATAAVADAALLRPTMARSPEGMEGF